MTWNYRLLAHEQNNEFWIEIHEVHYNESGEPKAYSQNSAQPHAEDKKSMQWVLNKMQDALKKPILWAGEKFPQECKIKYKCDNCGTDTFDRPSSHRCLNNFRKHGLTYTKIYK